MPIRETRENYRISLNIGQGVYFLPRSFDPALKRGRRLNRAGVYNVWYFVHAHVRVLARVGHSSDSSFEKASMIRGQHIYKSIWTPVVGEELTLHREDSNDHDIHAVAVVKDGDVVGHVPRSIFRVSRFLLVRGGRIKCRVTGRRKFGNGLKVPCMYSYYGSARTIQKL